MKLIKLDAIDSTNDFLKDLSNHQSLDNFTVVTATTQTNGRGQMGAKWTSEPYKNLIMSVLLVDFIDDINNVFQLNELVSLSVYSALEKYNLPNLAIKWPNDIMSDGKKIGGILIENTIKADGKISSVIGIGLNVNQLNFEELSKASSLAKIKGANFEIDTILIDIVNSLKTNYLSFQDTIADYHAMYIQRLFKIGIPMPFENNSGTKFMGIIQNVNKKGLLEILLEDNSVATFNLKEIKMLY